MFLHRYRVSVRRHNSWYLMTQRAFSDSMAFIPLFMFTVLNTHSNQRYIPRHCLLLSLGKYAFGFAFNVWLQISSESVWH